MSSWFRTHFRHLDRASIVVVSRYDADRRLALPCVSPSDSDALLRGVCVTDQSSVFICNHRVPNFSWFLGVAR